MKVKFETAWDEKEMILVPTIGIGFKAKSIYIVWLFWAMEIYFK